MRTFRPPEGSRGLRLAMAVLMALGALLPVGAVAFFLGSLHGVAYQITGGRLEVRSGDRLSGSQRIPLTDITAVRTVDLQGGRRRMGTGMPGYCVGRWAYPALGEVWQATDCGSPALLIQVNGLPQPVLVRPPDLDDFHTRLTEGTETLIQMPAPSLGPVLPVGLMAGLMGLAAGIGVGVLLVAGPGAMRYELPAGEGVLNVRTLYGRASFPLRGARARRVSPERLRRVFGTAAPGYLSGQFSDAVGGLRVFATTRDDGVLLEGESRVFVSPKDVDGFLAALAREGVTVAGHPL